MKPKYEKPQVIDLNVPKAWGDISTMGACENGSGVGSGGSLESCAAGWEPDKDGQCHEGFRPSNANWCEMGSFV